MGPRTRTGLVCLLVSAGAMALGLYGLASGGLRLAAAAVLLSIAAVGFIAAVVLLGMTSSSTSSAAAVAWSLPGLLALLPFGVALLQRGFDSPLGLNGLLQLIGLAPVVAGILSPLASMATSSVAWRSQRRSHGWLAALSWCGAITFWGKFTGVILADW
jgi:hypothetical protein